MNWYEWALIGIAATAIITGLLVWLIRIFQSREPYASMLRLRTRDKIRFFKLIVTDKRVPKIVKAIPILVALYLAMPIDLIPDFVPVLGYLDDVGIVIGALALIVRLTPSEVITDLIDQANSTKVDSGNDVNSN